jgi:hypothetical protein
VRVDLLPGPRQPLVDLVKLGVEERLGLQRVGEVALPGEPQLMVAEALDTGRVEGELTEGSRNTSFSPTNGTTRRHS